MDDFGYFGNYGHNNNYDPSYNHLEGLLYEGSFKANGEGFDIIKEKPNLSGLLEAGKNAQEKLQPTAPRESNSQEILPETSIKPDPSYNHLEGLLYEGSFKANGEGFDIIKEKPNLSGLLEAGKNAQEKLQPTAPRESNSQEILPETSIKPEVAIPLYKAIGEGFSSDRQMKKYLCKMKRIKEKKKSPDDSEGITTDTA